MNRNTYKQFLIPPDPNRVLSSIEIETINDNIVTYIAERYPNRDPITFGPIENGVILEYTSKWLTALGYECNIIYNVYISLQKTIDPSLLKELLED